MNPTSVEVGSIYERMSGPRLTAKVVAIEGEQAMCRMYRESGSSLGGLRPVPLSLLVEPYFKPLLGEQT